MGEGEEGVEQICSVGEQDKTNKGTCVFEDLKNYKINSKILLKIIQKNLSNFLKTPCPPLCMTESDSQWDSVYSHYYDML